MGLLAQIRFLDRLVHDHRARSRFLADRHSAVAELEPGDRGLFLATDGPRLEVFARDIAAKIDGRWYSERFAATLGAAGRVLGGDRGRAVLELMANPAFAEAVGEDDTGHALVAMALDVADTHAAEWLAELAVYEWLLGVGLPDLAAQGRLPVLPSIAPRLGRCLRALGSLPRAPDRASLLRPALRLELAHDIPSLADALASGLDVRPLPEPTRIIFFVHADHVDEIADDGTVENAIAALALPRPELERRRADDPDLADALQLLVSEGLIELA